MFPGSSETFIVNKFLALLERGWDVHIFCSHFDREKWAEFPGLKGYPSVKNRVHRSWPIEPRWLVPLLLLPALLYTLIRRPRSTLIYLNNGWSHFGPAVIKRFYLDFQLVLLSPGILHFEFGSLAVGRTYLKDSLDCKLSVSFRGYDLNFVALDDPNYYMKLWTAIDGCHLLSKHLWERAKARGCPTDSFHSLIPPAVDLTSFPRPRIVDDVKLEPSNKRIRILSVGRLEWKKGYEHALQAIRLLKDQGISFEYQIIGDGDYKTPLYFAKYQMGLTENVQFLGYLSHHGVIEKMRSSDIFLHPSLSEGFCNAVLEAQAMSLPVVCTNAGGLAENVVDGVTGFIVPRRGPIAMAEKLALLAEDVTLRRKMGQAGRKRVEAHFRMDQQLDAFENFFLSISSNLKKKSIV